MSAVSARDPFCTSECWAMRVNGIRPQRPGLEKVRHPTTRKSPSMFHVVAGTKLLTRAASSSLWPLRLFWLRRIGSSDLEDGFREGPAPVRAPQSPLAGRLAPGHAGPPATTRDQADPP